MSNTAWVVGVVLLAVGMVVTLLAAWVEARHGGDDGEVP